MMFKLKPVKNYGFTGAKPLPGCGHDSGVFTVEQPYFEGGNIWVAGRIIGWCNRTGCEQRFYLFVATGRITRRNTGETLTQRYNRMGHY